ncbi:hypothetical protein [Epilithonimonas sp.]|uniref:hypothetical protein n=1 Tax=Epilithonimonas sp. TaxID=2894511 RepID=UPI0028AD4C61|nr:hypothetical protein [Epilithonimonas sp.]
MNSTEITNKAYNLRVNKGQLPTILIAGYTSFVEIKMDMLKPPDDFLSKRIVFSETQNYYDEEKRSYLIPYNPKTLEFQNIDFNNIKEFPKDLIAVKFSIENELDRIGWNRHHGFELRQGLFSQGFKKEFVAKQIPGRKLFSLILLKII